MRLLSYNHAIFSVISGILLAVAVTSVAMIMIQQVLAASNTNQVVKVRGPQDKFLTDEPVVSQAGSNMTGLTANTTGGAPGSLPATNPAGLRHDHQDCGAIRGTPSTLLR